MTGLHQASMRMLLEPDAAELLTKGEIPYVDHGLARTRDEAVACANRLGYPVVLKIVSRDIIHKSDVGGVVTGLSDEASVAGGYTAMLERIRAHVPSAAVEGVLVSRHVTVARELIVGALRDATFGPAVMVGLGGVFAEVLDDVAFRLAPLNLADAAEMLRDLRGSAVLGAYRGGERADLDAAAALLVRLGELIVAQPQIMEIDLNPVAVDHRGVMVLDARIIVEGAAGPG